MTWRRQSRAEPTRGVAESSPANRQKHTTRDRRKEHVRLTAVARGERRRQWGCRPRGQTSPVPPAQSLLDDLPIGVLAHNLLAPELEQITAPYFDPLPVRGRPGQ